MNKYILDRIEADVAILETEKGEFLNISSSILPDNTNEGDVILFDNDEYTILSDETDKRKKRIKNLRNSLRE